MKIRYFIACAMTFILLGTSAVVFAEGENDIQGIVFEVDPKTSKALWIKTVKF